jgi:hypothetical protein
MVDTINTLYDASVQPGRTLTDYVPTVASEISKVFLDLSMKTVRRDYVGHSIMCNVKDVLLKVYFGYAPCWRDRLLQFLGSVCG